MTCWVKGVAHACTYNVSYPISRSKLVWVHHIILVSWLFLIRRCFLNINTFLSAKLNGIACKKRVFFFPFCTQITTPHTAEPWQG